jgi:hypothetical protein
MLCGVEIENSVAPNLWATCNSFCLLVALHRKKFPAIIMCVFNIPIFYLTGTSQNILYYPVEKSHIYIISHRLLSVHWAKSLNLLQYSFSNVMLLVEVAWCNHPYNTCDDQHLKMANQEILLLWLELTRIIRLWDYSVGLRFWICTKNQKHSII